MIRKALLVTMAASMLVAATGCGNQQKAAETKAAETKSAETKAAEEKDGEKKFPWRPVHSLEMMRLCSMI